MLRSLVRVLHALALWGAPLIHLMGSLCLDLTPLAVSPKKYPSEEPYRGHT